VRPVEQGQGLKLRLRVGRSPDPLRLPAALSARLSGRSFPPGPEDEIGREVAAALARRLQRGEVR
jgi:hypothetical protein